MNLINKEHKRIIVQKRFTNNPAVTNKDKICKRLFFVGPKNELNREALTKLTNP